MFGQHSNKNVFVYSPDLRKYKNLVIICEKNIEYSIKFNVLIITKNTKRTTDWLEKPKIL